MFSLDIVYAMWILLYQLIANMPYFELEFSLDLNDLLTIFFYFGAVLQHPQQNHLWSCIAEIA